MDLSAAILDLDPQSLTVTRSAAATYTTGGKLVAPVTSTFTIVASVQPAPGKQLMRLPEGLRNQDVLQVFTATEIRTAQSGVTADVVAIGSGSYQVESVKDWSLAGGFYDALVRRIG